MSCVTTVSMESETERDPEARLQDFREEDERCVYRSENTEFKRREIQLLCSEQIQLVVVGQEWERGDCGHCGGGQRGQEAAAHGS